MTTGRIPSVEGGIQPTIVDAKGDILTATAADTPAVLAVGNNGETLVADSSATTGLRYNPTQAAGKNYIINGAFDIWQRGTSFTNPAIIYTADRWVAGSHSASTLTRQNSDLTGFQYFARYQRTAGSAVTSGMTFATSLETVNSIPLAGKTVTLSFYARAGANYSATGNNLNYSFFYGTGTDQNIFGTYTGATSIATSSVVLTTSWQRFSFTATISSSANELAFYFTGNPTGTAGANDYYDVTGIQLEIGSTATAFTRTGGTLAGELAACQRYCWKITSDAADKSLAVGGYWGTDTFLTVFQYPVTMRTTPAATIVNGTNYWIIYRNGSTDPCDTAGFANASANACNIEFTGNVSGTIGHAGQVRSNNASASIILSAEL